MKQFFRTRSRTSFSCLFFSSQDNRYQGSIQYSEYSTRLSGIPLPFSSNSRYSEWAGTWTGLRLGAPSLCPSPFYFISGESVSTLSIGISGILGVEDL